MPSSALRRAMGWCHGARLSLVSQPFPTPGVARTASRGDQAARGDEDYQTKSGSAVLSILHTKRQLQPFQTPAPQHARWELTLRNWYRGKGLQHLPAPELDLCQKKKKRCK